MDSRRRTRRIPRATTGRLLGDVRRLIESAREQTARAVNAGLVTLYWSIGSRVRKDLLKEKRAGYGDRLISDLGRKLSSEYGPGFGPRNLFRMVRMAEIFPHFEKVSALRTQLGWTHFRALISIRDPLEREFYAELCRLERWSTRTLERKVAGMLFERTALSRKPAPLVRQELAAVRDEDRVSPDLVFRDPYVLDFLDLGQDYAEKDLESAILRELESFLLELGTGFTFVARQKRIEVDHEDYRLDLLLYHRDLRRLVAVELKLGRFRAADKGQMELYLRWLDRYERRSGEDPPIGLILCAGKSDEQIELLELWRSGIRVAEYVTQLPPRRVLARKLHAAMREARRRLAGSGRTRFLRGLRPPRRGPETRLDRASRRAPSRGE